MWAWAFFSNVVMFFIILTTAITLNRHGIKNIETTRQAADALRPLAGKFAATLFTVGIVGVEFLASRRWRDQRHTPSRKRLGGAKDWTRN